MTTNHSRSHSRDAGVTAVAFTLILAGALLLLDNLGMVWIDHVWNLWPISLIAVGVAELIHWRRQNQA